MTDSSERFWIGVRYDVEPRLIGANRTAALDRVRADFQQLKSSGFDTVVLWHVDPAIADAVSRCAGEIGIRCVGWADVRPAVGGANTAHSASPRVAIVGSEGALADPPESAAAELLARYVRELAAGRTAGLVVDRFERAPGDPPGLADMVGSPTAARATALRTLLARARAWGARLTSFAPRTVSEAATSEDGIELTIFMRGRRSYLLVLNSNRDAFVRRMLDTDTSVLGDSVERLVAVPPWPGERPGEVLSVQGGRVSIPLNLSPGEAVLFEIF